MLIGKNFAVIAVAVGIAVATSACASHNPRPSQRLFPDENITVMGHRGARGVAPENTMAAFEVANRLNLSFELDTHLSKDGKMVVFHDGQLNRTTDGEGPLRAKTFTELTALDAGSHFSDEFRGEQIPSLDAVLDTYAKNVLVNIEVKSNQGTDNQLLAQAVVEAVKSRELEDRVLISSFSPYLLEQVRLLAPELYRGQIYGQLKDSDLSFPVKFVLKNLLLNKKAVPDLLMVESVMATPKYVQKMHKKGYRVFAWTVNSDDDVKRMLAAGVDGIITDYPERVLRLVETTQ